EGYRKAISDQKLRVVGQPDIEEIQFSKGRPFQFAVTLETAPDFELPEYKGLPVKREMAVVTEEDLERALNVLREQRAVYMDEARAKSYGAEDMAKLRAGVRTDLQNELNYKIKRNVRDQLVRELLKRVNCELPESIVLSETRNVVYDIVRENQQRGVSKETIEQQKDQIFSVANNSARDRIKAAFVLGRIAEKEAIKVEQKELSQRVLMLAEQYQLKPEQMVKQLRDRNGFGEIEEQIMSEKVLDFLELNAKVEEVLPTARTLAQST